MKSRHLPGRRSFLGFRVRLSFLAAATLSIAGLCFGQNPPKVTLDSSETLFTILASINHCGYDEGLNGSDPLRAQIRAEVNKAAETSLDAQQASNLMCSYYHEHVQADNTRILSRYISLALFLDGPPNFVPKVSEFDLPPDAGSVIGFAKLAATFYDHAGLHGIWQRHRSAYTTLAERYHDPLAKMLFNTEIYLKLPSSAGYLGREFTVYLEPMGDPDQENARNYGSNYYVVISPVGSSLKVDEIRHTYLHYLLDPLALKYSAEMKRLAPLEESVKAAPMDEEFKTDTALLVTECLIRAIEIRMANPKAPETLRADDVQKSMEQGFILTRYFYDALVQFEKDPASLRDAYSDLLAAIDVGKEKKRASGVQFASEASPELLYLSRRSDANLLQVAEKRLTAGDLKSAQDLAQQAIQEKRGDQGRALFIMAQVATAQRDMEGAQGYFQRAIQTAQEPQVVAWSHIYLGRIYDLREERDAAMNEYRAALNAGSTGPEVKAAAERGLDHPYEPPVSPR